jgi:hypothetical protein
MLVPPVTITNNIVNVKDEEKIEILTVPNVVFQK